MDMTRGDIDECASAYVMIDKDGNPTGASPPDPDRAYCMVCRRRSMAIGSMSAAGPAAEKCSQLSDAKLLAKLGK